MFSPFPCCCFLHRTSNLCVCYKQVYPWNTMQYSNVYVVAIQLYPVLSLSMDNVCIEGRSRGRRYVNEHLGGGGSAVVFPLPMLLFFASYQLSELCVIVGSPSTFPPAHHSPSTFPYNSILFSASQWTMFVLRGGVGAGDMLMSI